MVENGGDNSQLTGSPPPQKGGEGAGGLKKQIMMTQVSGGPGILCS